LNAKAASLVATETILAGLHSLLNKGKKSKHQVDVIKLNWFLLPLESRLDEMRNTKVVIMNGMVVS
jgi:hypothetical protein